MLTNFSRLQAAIAASRGDRGRLMLQSVLQVSGNRSGLSKLQILTPQIKRPLCTVTSSHTVNPKADNSQSIISPAVSWQWNGASLSLALENINDNHVSEVQYHLCRSPYYYCFHCLIILAHMAISDGHLKIHHDFKVLTLGKDGKTSISLHYERWIQTSQNLFIFLLRTSG